MTKRRPPLSVRAVVRVLRELGYDYSLMPFSERRECNICGYQGKFKPSGLYYRRPDAICTSCLSTDRQRLLAYYFRNSTWDPTDKSILHFAPEQNIGAIVEPSAAEYVTADLLDERADFDWNIECINCEDEKFDAVICSHVLEHVETFQALTEIFRVLRPGGKAFLMIPIYEGLDTTYHDPEVREGQRHLHFHQPDHVRLIGRDFRRQVTDAGFALSEYNADHEAIIRYGMMVGEKVFIGTNPV